MKSDFAKIYKANMVSRLNTIAKLLQKEYTN